jgi:hypothetical protein
LVVCAAWRGAGVRTVMPSSSMGSSSDMVSHCESLWNGTMSEPTTPAFFSVEYTLPHARQRPRARCVSSAARAHQMSPRRMPLSVLGQMLLEV